MLGGGASCTGGHRENVTTVVERVKDTMAQIFIPIFSPRGWGYCQHRVFNYLHHWLNSPPQIPGGFRSPKRGYSHTGAKVIEYSSTILSKHFNHCRCWGES